MSEGQALFCILWQRRTSSTSGNLSLRLTLLAACRVREDILDAIRALVPFPHQGHRRTDLTSRPLRFKTVRDYLIACAPDEHPLLVIAMLHGRRSPRVMAALLRVRD